MSIEKVTFGFVIVLACTLNFGFFVGDISRPELHHPAALAAAVIVNLLATAMKLGDRTQMGATHLATSVVASLQLVAASIVWLAFKWRFNAPTDAELTAVIVSLSGGALLANLFSVVLLLGETLRHGRHK
jgi:Ca2+/H+ antiporter, TMEM165/GDT1 family